MFELECYIEGIITANQITRTVIPCSDIRDHVATQFLNLWWECKCQCNVQHALIDIGVNELTNCTTERHACGHQSALLWKYATQCTITETSFQSTLPYLKHGAITWNTVKVSALFTKSIHRHWYQWVNLLHHWEVCGRQFTILRKYATFTHDYGHVIPINFNIFQTSETQCKGLPLTFCLWQRSCDYRHVDVDNYLSSEIINMTSWLFSMIDNVTIPKELWTTNDQEVSDIIVNVENSVENFAWKMNCVATRDTQCFTNHRVHRPLNYDSVNWNAVC